MNTLQQLEQDYMAEMKAKRTIPEFNPGDTLRVYVKVVEGQRERTQAYEGVCIARRNAGVNSSFTVRKISFGEGVERVFPLFAPIVDKIEVVRKGRVRRAKQSRLATSGVEPIWQIRIETRNLPGFAAGCVDIK